MSSLPIQFALEADAEIEDCYAHIAAESSVAAERFQEALSQAFERISTHPGIGAEWSAIAQAVPGIRRWAVRGFPNHLILYRVMPERIDVVALLHGARDLGQVFTSARQANLDEY
jgi:toxin ParE1/3/4